MADTKISALTAATLPLTGNEKLPVVQSGVTLETTTQAVVNLGKQVSTSSVLLGRGSAAGAGAQQEIALGSGLSMAGTTLSVTVAGNALTTNPLSQFAPTTSAQLAGVLTDETGSGAAVFATSPTLSNPIVGTQSPSNNSTLAASTAYADAAVAAGTFVGGTLTKALNEAPPATIASSSTPAIFAAAGNTINLTGNVTVTGFDTIAAGAFRRIIFGGALQLTNGTALQNITGANITTAAGDVAEVESLGSGNTKMLSYTRANGQPLVSSGGIGGVNAQTGTSYTFVAGDAGKLVTFSNALATAASLPQATGSFANPWCVFARNLGNGVVTITPTTSTIDGAATLALRRGDGAFIFADGTNYSIVLVRAQSRGVTTLTSGSTISVDASIADSFRIVLGTNATLANPTNLVDGQVLNFRLIQDATGSRTLAFGSLYKFAGGAAPTASTAANTKDFMSAQYDATDNTLDCSYLKAFA